SYLSFLGNAYPKTRRLEDSPAGLQAPRRVFEPWGYRVSRHILTGGRQRNQPPVDFLTTHHSLFTTHQITEATLAESPRIRSCLRFAPVGRRRFPGRRSSRRGRKSCGTW